MPRIRSYKPELWSHENFNTATPVARLLLLGLGSYADAQGVLPAEYGAIKARIFPMDRDIDAAKVRAMVMDLWEADLIRFFTAQGRELIAIMGFCDTTAPFGQYLGKEKARYPAPSGLKSFSDQSPAIPGLLGDSLESFDQKSGTSLDKSRQNCTYLISDTDSSDDLRRSSAIADQAHEGHESPRGRKPRNSSRGEPGLDLASDGRAAAQPPVAAQEPQDAAPIQLWEYRPPDGDWARALFGPGRAYVMRQTGMSSQAAGGLIGRWLKMAGRRDGGQDHRKVYDALARAQTESSEGVSDLRAWMGAALRGPESSAGSGRVISMVRTGGAKTAYQRAVEQWEDGGYQGARPRLEDFEGAA